MPSRKISLTTHGFKILSNDLIIDLFSVSLVGFFLVYGQTWTLERIFSFSIFFLLTSFVYVYYNYKIGYMYVLGFIYQIFLYLVITPTIYINFVNILLTSIITFGLLYKQNSFGKIYFPLGLFMSLVSTSMGFIATKLNIFRYPLLSADGLEFQKFSSNFFDLEYLHFAYFHSELFSPLEKVSFLSLLALGILIFREYSLILDWFNTMLCFFLTAWLYNFEINFYKEKIIAVVMTWVLFVYGPGRNFGFSYSFITIALGLTGIFSYTIWTLKQNLPNVVYLSLYFLIQSLLFVLNHKVQVQLWKINQRSRIK